jgi:hypothetical protein
MKTYDPRDINVIVNGQFLTGFAEGNFVTAEKDEENYSTHVGAKGEVSRARNADPMGTITINLKNTSPSNAVLNKLAKSRDTFELYVVDANENAKKAGGSICWAEKPADLSWGDEIETIEWNIKIADYSANMD